MMLLSMKAQTISHIVVYGRILFSKASTLKKLLVLGKPFHHNITEMIT